jgi:hypothetical protein
MTTELINDLRSIQHESVFAMTIRAEIERHPDAVIKMILDQINDNSELCELMIGKETVAKIKSLTI